MHLYSVSIAWHAQEELETEAMRAGTRIHAELEAETSHAVEVPVATWEDFWAVSPWRFVRP